MLRRIVVCVALVLLADALRAEPPSNVAEQYLFQAANAERRARGLPPLRWDESLHEAAWLHARQMAARASISHQYPGEPELTARAQEAGAHFSVVAENVAEAPTAVAIHYAWMNSEHHRENLLDARVDRVGISVLMRGGELYAVQDFERSVVAMSYDEQESTVARLLASTVPLEIRTGGADARQTCELDTGYVGPRKPWFVMRFTTGELNTLPEQLQRRLATGKYHQAVVGACAARESGPFSSYNIAVLLYP